MKKKISYHHFTYRAWQQARRKACKYNHLYILIADQVIVSYWGQLQIGQVQKPVESKEIQEAFE